MGESSKGYQYSYWIAIVCSFLFMVIMVYKEVYYPMKITREYENLIYEGVYINENHVGGLSKKEAISFIGEKLSKEMLYKKIRLWYSKKYDEVNYVDLGVCHNVEEVVEKAFNAGKEHKGIIRGTLQRVKTKLSQVNLSTEILFNETKLNLYSEKISQIINKDCTDARVTFTNNDISIIDETNGRKVNISELKFNIKKAILSGKNEVDIPVKLVKPNINAEMLTSCFANFSSFSTPLLSKDANRTENIIIAANSINGFILYPGEVFSANKAIGPRTKEKGYKNAPIFQGGKVVPGLAGGICQLVTTIYNTALNADFKIIERTRHGQPVNYVAPGMDATIAGDVIDLKFKNTSDYPVYIQAYVDKDYVTVKFYKINMSCNIHSYGSYLRLNNDYLNSIDLR